MQPEREPCEERDSGHEQELERGREERVTALRPRLEDAATREGDAERDEHERHRAAPDDPERLDRGLGQVDAEERHAQA